MTPYILVYALELNFQKSYYYLFVNYIFGNLQNYNFNFCIYLFLLSLDNTLNFIFPLPSYYNSFYFPLISFNPFLFLIYSLFSLFTNNLRIVLKLFSKSLAEGIIPLSSSIFSIELLYTSNPLILNKNSRNPTLKFILIIPSILLSQKNYIISLYVFISIGNTSDTN